ncbi:MAG: hypothetical protein KGN00_08720 [Chloroflexota bacterium]|nr:hypothetical protein [Chloroflexota bacterium]
MARTTDRLVGAAALALALAALSPATASAHEISKAGVYRIAIGWLYEPPTGSVTYVGEPNAVQIFVDKPTAGNEIGDPVGDLNKDCDHPDLQVTVTFGGATSRPLCPQPAYDPDTGLGRQDEYDAAITPTAAGDYTFHLFGTIHGEKVDHTVKSGPDTFDAVGDASAVEFPTAAPALGDVAAKVDRVGARAGDAASAAQAAADAANRATILAIVGAVLAVVAGIVSVAALRRRPGA